MLISRDSRSRLSRFFFGTLVLNIDQVGLLESSVVSLHVSLIDVTPRVWVTPVINYEDTCLRPSLGKGSCLMSHFFSARTTGKVTRKRIIKVGTKIL